MKGRSAWTAVSTAVRRLGDVLGLGAVAAAGAVLAVVALLGVLVAFGQLVAAGLVLLIVAAAAVVVVVRVLRPVRALTRDVGRAAAELPATLAVAPAADAPDLAAAGPPELDALAGAVTSMRAVAVSFVTHERERHRRAGDLTAHLARRNHGLVDRLVAQIDELEATERSPVVLAQLSRLKHTATRTRRHAESMLVLTGSLPDRFRPRPAALADVLRSALTGIEDHARVATDVEPAAVSGSAFADLAHLVAELVENATHFSPPGTRILITGASEPDVGYRLRIVDHGVGMTVDQLGVANGRIRNVASDVPSTKLIGLDVVGRLAARHGIDVILTHGDDAGVIATVNLPAGLLVPLSVLPAPRRPVSALVAAAAFRPPLAVGGELPSLRPAADAEQPEPAAVDAPEMLRPGVPRRVRGAQLPDLGPDRKDGPQITPDAGRVHGRLHALQSGLSAARTDNIPPLPQALIEPDEPAPDVPGRAPDGDD